MKLLGTKTFYPAFHLVNLPRINYHLDRMLSHTFPGEMYESLAVKYQGSVSRVAVVTFGVVRKCALASPETFSNGGSQKALYLSPLEGEWERTIELIGVLFGKKKIAYKVFNGGLILKMFSPRENKGMHTYYLLTTSMLTFYNFVTEECKCKFIVLIYTIFI